MRFMQLVGLTTLPLGRIRRQFRYEDVRAVLLVRAARGQTDSLLVATSIGLAIVTALAGVANAWLTRWAPWDAVHLVEEADDHLTVRVDRVDFEARLAGETGQRTRRDFVVAADERREALAAHP